MKGFIMAGGNGSRLDPITKATSKQLLAIYDKPMIYYPLTTLMLAGINDIYIITNSLFLNMFKRVLEDGSKWGVKINYLIQAQPNGIADLFNIAKDLIKGQKIALILGDNLFHGTNLIKMLDEGVNLKEGAQIFAYAVKNIQDYGSVSLDSNNNPIKIEEKPPIKSSNYAIPGLYFYDETALEKFKKIKPSIRGELEISDINKLYLNEGKLNVKIMGRGMTWLDIGNIDALHDANTYVRTIENRQGLKIGCPEEVALRKKWITSQDLVNLIKKEKNNSYSDYLKNLIKRN